MASKRPGPLVETALWVADTRRSAEFYESHLGFRVLAAAERIAVLEIAAGQVLILCAKGGSAAPIATPGGNIPPGNADGEMHVAFAIEESEFEEWAGRLTAGGVPIESTVEWDKVPWPPAIVSRRGRSIYFRDPDGHSIELAIPGVWPGVY